jgi:hypothetical protein
VGGAYYLGYNKGGGITDIAYINELGFEVTQSDVPAGDTTLIVASGSFQFINGTSGNYVQSELSSSNTVTPDPDAHQVNISFPSGPLQPNAWAFYNYVNESGWRAESLPASSITVETICCGVSHIPNIQFYNYVNETVDDTEVTCTV